MSFQIIRFFQDKPQAIIKTGLTREEAINHCNDIETSSETCTEPQGLAMTNKWGNWFDGFQEVGE